MKKALVLILIALMPLASMAKIKKEAISKDKLVSIINKYEGEYGFEVVKVGSLGMTAIKSIVALGLAEEDDDPEAKEIGKVLKGIKRITVIDYDDCMGSVRDNINADIIAALDGAELILEAKDNGSSVYLYGVVDEKSNSVKDFIMFTPSEHALICLFGSMSIDAALKYANQ